MNITCRDVTELLIELMENTLPLEDKMRLQHHICSCVPCMIYTTTYKQTILLTRKLPEEPLPPELKTRLEAFFQEKCRALAESESDSNGTASE